MKRLVEEDKIIHRMNKLAREMDEIALSIHPSAWSETLRPHAQEWLKLNRRLNSL